MLADGILVYETMQRGMRRGTVCTDAEPCSNSRVPAFRKCVLRAYYVLHALLGVRDTAVNKTDTYLCSHGAYIYIEGERDGKQVGRNTEGVRR